MGKRGERKGNLIKSSDAVEGLNNEYSCKKILPKRLWYLFCNSLKTDRYFQLLLVITSIAFILRFYHLDFNSLWLDEVYTYTFSQESFTAIWEICATREPHPPLFYFLEHLMLQINNSEFILRFIPALAGSLSIPGIYLVGQKIVDRNVGIISAVLLTFSYYHIFLSQEARSYTLLILFVLISTYFYFRSLNEKKYENWIFTGIFLGLTIWTHYYGLYLVIVLALHYLIISGSSVWKNHPSHKIPLIGFLITLMISLPLLLLLPTVMGSKLGGRVAAPGATNYFELFTMVISYFGDSTVIFGSIFFILAVVGIAKLFSEKKQSSLFLALIIFLPLLISFILISNANISIRHLSFCLPFFYIAAGASYLWLLPFSSWRKIILFVIMALILISIPGMIQDYSSYNKADWRGASLFIEESTVPGDFVVILPEVSKFTIGYYYNNNSDQTILYGTSKARDLQSFAEKHNDSDIYFVVLTGSLKWEDPQDEALLWLQNNAKQVSLMKNPYILRLRHSGA